MAINCNSTSCCEKDNWQAFPAVVCSLLPACLTAGQTPVKILSFNISSISAHLFDLVASNLKSIRLNSNYCYLQPGRYRDIFGTRVEYCVMN
jgi:hypothetical protein